MEPLEDPTTSIYGYNPCPCDFARVAGELEAMASTDVDATIETSFGSGRELLRTQGRLGLAEKVSGHEPRRLRYALGEDGSSIEICEEEFNRGQLIPGRVWFELKSGVVLSVERRHGARSGR